MSVLPQTLIYVGGIYSIGFIIFHLTFWKCFAWDSDLQSLSFINRCVIQILNISLIWVFAIFAILSIVFTKDLLTTELGRAVVVLIGIFWWFRALQQILFFGLKNTVSVTFFILFLVGGGVYFLPLFLAATITVDTL